MAQPIMFTITGPSCAGKTTLMEKLLENYPDQFVKLISDTTRPPRAGEVEGEEYHFVDDKEFKLNLLNDVYCQHVEYSGVRYGTRTDSIQQAFASGKTPIRVVEPTGVGQFEAVCLSLGAKVFAIFVNESPMVILSRWLNRYHKDPNRDPEFYARRIMTTLTREVEWHRLALYHFNYDLSIMDDGEALYALSRIATGNMSWGVAKVISPMPREEESSLAQRSILN